MNTRTFLPWTAFALALSLTCADAQADARSPRLLELECHAECWYVDAQQGTAYYVSRVYNWGAQAASELLWRLRSDQCADGVLVHTRLIGMQAGSNEWEREDSQHFGNDTWTGDFSRFYYRGQSTSNRSFARNRIRVRSQHSAVQLEFDSATPANSCRPTRSSGPVRHIGGNPVGG